MSLTLSQRKTLHRKITAYVVAAIRDSWAGGGDPADVPLLEANLNITERDLSSYIKSLTEKEPLFIR